jgi:hypothetical protein
MVAGRARVPTQALSGLLTPRSPLIDLPGRPRGARSHRHHDPRHKKAETEPLSPSNRRPWFGATRAHDQQPGQQ